MREKNMAWSNCVYFVMLLGCVKQMLSKVAHQKIFVEKDTTEIYLNCSTQEAVAWLHGEIILMQDGRKVTTDPRFQMIIDTYVAQLHIRDIMSNYSGQYTCADNENKSIATFEVIIVEHLTAQEHDTNISVVEGSTAKLMCNVQGRPEPEYKWYIVNDDNIDIGITGKMLQIRNFSRECAVKYMCIAKHNNSGNVNITFTPIPKFQPEVRIIGNNLTTTNNSLQIVGSIGMPFEFVCVVTANPFVNITVTKDKDWLASVFKNNTKKPILNETNPDIYEYMFSTHSDINEPYSYDLVVKGNIKKNLFGIYECGSKNIHGMDRKIIKIMQKVGG